MNRVIIFGASESSKNLYRLIEEKYDIIAYTDNDKEKWGKKWEVCRSSPQRKY